MKFTYLFVAGAALAAASAANAQEITGDAEAGAKVFNKCKACHVVDEAKNRVGPHLVGIINRPVAAVEDFKYSDAMKEFGAEGKVWDVAALTEYLADPKGTVPKTKMAFPGLKSDEDIANVIAYMNEEGGSS